MTATQFDFDLINRTTALYASIARSYARYSFVHGAHAPTRFMCMCVARHEMRIRVPLLDS